jgi:nucleoside-diphosphate-sugar epimerase
MSDAVGVTGSSGFIGSHLCNELGPIALSLDLRNSSDDAIRDLLIKKHCQTIVHLATPLINKSKLTAIEKENNGEGVTLRLLEILQPLRPLNLIFLSTVRVHPRGSKIFSAESPIDPIDAYGKDKHATERLLMKSPHQIFCIRASSVQGVDFEGKARGIIGTFSKQAKREGIIKIMGDGKSMKDLLHVSDLCELIKSSVTNFENLIGRILPVGGDSSNSVLNLAKRVQLYSEAEIKHIKADPFDLSGEVNNSSIFGLSDWRPSQTIDEMIKEALKAVRKEKKEI